MTDPSLNIENENSQEPFSPLGFVSELQEGQVVSLEHVIINTNQLVADFQWGAQKVVFQLEDKYGGREAVLKMYRDPVVEDQPKRSAEEEEIQITIYPPRHLVVEPPLGTVELSNFKRDQYVLARSYFGDQVPDTTFFRAYDQNGTLRNWEAQTRIHGQIIMDSGWELKYSEKGAESILRMIEATQKMLEETGKIPDFQGDLLSNFNIVVEANGECFLVDTDAPLEIDPGVIAKIRNRNEKIAEGTTLHPLIIDWLQSSTSIEVERCRDALQETLESMERARRYFTETKKPNA